MNNNIDNEFLEKMKNILGDSLLRELISFNDETGKIESVVDNIEYISENVYTYDGLSLFGFLDGYKYVDSKGEEKTFDCESSKEKDFEELIKYMFKDEISEIQNLDCFNKDRLFEYLIGGDLTTNQLIEGIKSDIDEFEAYDYIKVSDIIKKGLDNYNTHQNFNDMVDYTIEDALDKLKALPDQNDIVKHNISQLYKLLKLNEKSESLATVEDFEVIVYYVPDVEYKLIDYVDEEAIIKRNLERAKHLLRDKYSLEDLVDNLRANDSDALIDIDACADDLYAMTQEYSDYINNNGVPYTREQIINYLKYGNIDVIDAIFRKCN